MSPTLLNFTTFTAMSHVELLEELRRREGDPRRRPHVLLVHEHDIPTDDCSVVAGIENSRVPLPTMFHVRFDDVASSDCGGTLLHIADAMAMVRWVHGLRGEREHEVLVACSSGTGRSTAICAAMLDCGLVACTQDILYEPGYDPNRTTYETVCAACARVLASDLPPLEAVDYFFPEE